MNEIITVVSKNSEEHFSTLNPSRFLLNLQGENQETLLEEVFSILGRSKSSLNQMHQLTLQGHFSLLLEIEIEEVQQLEIKTEDQMSNQRSKLIMKGLNTRLMTP